MDINPNLLNRFFQGKYSRKDYFEIKDIFSDVQKRSALKRHLENQWMEYSQNELPSQNVDHLLHKIHHKIRLEESTIKIKKALFTFQRVAAVLSLPLIFTLLTIIYFQSNKLKEATNTFAEIQCPLGVRTKFELPDGTTGFLNSGSRLKYPVNFSKGRKVKITGEAYFDVVHNENNPFVVQTNNLNVKVLGTQFNVIAYDDDLYEKVILNRGKVEISSPTNQKLEILQPDQKLVLNVESRKYHVNEVEASQYIGWIEGKLIFRNESMLQVAERLGRWYNADIEIQDKELYNYAFRATFIDESLEEVLGLMKLTAPFTFELQPRKQNNNIYQKRKVLIKLDKKRLQAFY